MEFIIGSGMVAIAISVLAYVIFKRNKPKKLKKIFFSQSLIYNLIAPAVPIIQEMNRKPLDTQATRHLEKDKIRVVFLEDKAYWIKDSRVFVADVVNNHIDQDSAKVVDTMAMDKVQLKELSYIIDILTEGSNNDRSNPRNKKF